MFEFNITQELETNAELLENISSRPCRFNSKKYEKVITKYANKVYKLKMSIFEFYKFHVPASTAFVLPYKYEI